MRARAHTHTHARARACLLPPAFSTFSYRYVNCFFRGDERAFPAVGPTHRIHLFAEEKLLLSWDWVTVQFPRLVPGFQPRFQSAVFVLGGSVCPPVRLHGRPACQQLVDREERYSRSRSPPFVSSLLCSLVIAGCSRVRRDVDLGCAGLSAESASVPASAVGYAFRR